MSPYCRHAGLQLYTVRDSFTKDPSDTFQRIAAIGYQELELFDPVQLQYTQEIRDQGMNVVSTLFWPGYISGLWNDFKKAGMAEPGGTIDDIIEACVKNKVHHLGIIMLWPEERQTLDDYRRFAGKANVVGEKAKSAGVQLYYHNHSFEFEPVNGTTPYAELLREFDHDLVKLELDVFWAAISGNDPVALINKLEGRIALLHLKDLAAGTARDYHTFDVDPSAFRPVGSGMLDFKEILEAAHHSNIPYSFVEQDHAGPDPFESIQSSYAYLQQLGL